MKTLIIVALLAVPSMLEAAWVNGYIRQNGTYVQGHYRSDPDNSPYNNQSYPGNLNYNTGEVTKGSQSEYLRNYYEPKSSYESFEIKPIDQINTTESLPWMR